MIHVKRWLGVEKMNLKFRDWVLLATPLFIFFSYHPVISLGKGEFRTNYEFSLIQIQLIILVLLHIPIIWEKRFTLLKNKAVQLALLFAFYNSITVIWSPNVARGLLTAGLIWLLVGVFLSILSNYKVERLKLPLLKVFIGSATIISVFAIYQFIVGLTPWSSATLLCAGCVADQFGFVRPNGFAIEPQFLGSLLLAPALLMMHAVLSSKVRKLYLSLFALFVFTIFLTLSRGAIFSLAIGVIALLVIERKPLKRSVLPLAVIAISLVATLGAQGLATQLNPNITETFVHGVTKSLHQLSMGTIDLRPKNSDAPVSQPTVNQPKFDGYVERSTGERLDSSCIGLNAWSSTLPRTVFGVGLGGAGYFFEHEPARSGLWCKINT